MAITVTNSNSSDHTEVAEHIMVISGLLNKLSFLF